MKRERDNLQSSSPESTKDTLSNSSNDLDKAFNSKIINTKDCCAPQNENSKKKSIDHSKMKNSMGDTKMCHTPLQTDPDIPIYKTKDFWFLMIGLFMLIFAVWVMAFGISSDQLKANGGIGSIIYIPAWMTNPWFAFTLALITSLLLAPTQINEVKNHGKGLSAHLFLVISVAIAFFSSLILSSVDYAQGLYNQGGYYYDAVVEILVIVGAGRYIEMYVTKKTEKNVESIQKLIVQDAILLRGIEEVAVKSNDLVTGDIVIVKNGQYIPTDGIIIKGSTDINEATITGEALPQFKTIGDQVYGGTISDNGTITVRITSIQSESLVGKIVTGIEKAKDAQPEPQIIANKISKWFLPLIFVVAVIGFVIFGSLRNDWIGAIEVFITVLIVACPMSFILLTPIVSVMISAKATKEGMSFQSKRPFEMSKPPTVMAFDKTGTLTYGKPVVEDISVDLKYHSIIKTIESASNHLVAVAIVNHLEDSAIIQNASINEVKGQGMNAIIDNTKYYIGSHKYIKSILPNFIEDEAWIKLKSEGAMVMYVATDKELLGYIVMRDMIKESSFQMIKILHEMKIKTIMITGDDITTANFVANKLGIDKVYANLMPEDKAEIIRDIKKTNKIGYVGDGINDSIALETSNLGFAMGQGTDVAKATADVLVADDDMLTIIDTLNLIKRSYKTIYAGLWAAVIYNMCTLSVAAAALVGPAVGAIFMVVNDLMPLFFGLTVKGFKPVLKQRKYKKFLNGQTSPTISK